MRAARRVPLWATATGVVAAMLVGVIIWGLTRGHQIESSPPDSSAPAVSLSPTASQISAAPLTPEDTVQVEAMMIDATRIYLSFPSQTPWQQSVEQLRAISTPELIEKLTTEWSNSNFGTTTVRVTDIFPEEEDHAGLYKNLIRGYSMEVRGIVEVSAQDVDVQFVDRIVSVQVIQTADGYRVSSIEDIL